MSTEEISTVTFKKVSSAGARFRRGGASSAASAGTKRQKRSSDSESGGEDPVQKGGSSSDEETTIVRVDARNRFKNPMVQTSGLSNKAKRPRRGSGSEDEEFESGATKTSAVGVVFEASKISDRLGPADQGATATIETETAFDSDAQAIFIKTQELGKELLGKEDDKIYRGLNAYAFKEKKDSAAGNAASGFVRKGPIRAPNFLRATVRWDYAPDLCKDYKETGFCGFGDSCKFMHDRGDYKAGWELEREHRSGTYGKRDEENFEIPDEEEELPFKCFICRESFVHPVMTKCKHYFCEKCALEQFRKTNRCYVCGKETHGVFNPAKELIAKLKDREAEPKDEEVLPKEGEEGEEHEHSEACPSGAHSHGPTKGRGACFTCGVDGHISRECPQNGGVERGQALKTGQCFNCGKHGHLSRDCSARRNRGGGGGGGRGKGRGEEADYGWD